MACSPPGSSVCGISQASTGVGCHFLLQGNFPDPESGGGGASNPQLAGSLPLELAGRHVMPPCRAACLYREGFQAQQTVSLRGIQAEVASPPLSCPPHFPLLNPEPRSRGPRPQFPYSPGRGHPHVRSAELPGSSTCGVGGLGGKLCSGRHLSVCSPPAKVCHGIQRACWPPTV